MADSRPSVPTTVIINGREWLVHAGERKCYTVDNRMTWYMPDGSLLYQNDTQKPRELSAVVAQHYREMDRLNPDSSRNRRPTQLPDPALSSLDNVVSGQVSVSHRGLDVLKSITSSVRARPESNVSSPVAGSSPSAAAGAAAVVSQAPAASRALVRSQFRNWMFRFTRGVLEELRPCLLWCGRETTYPVFLNQEPPCSPIQADVESALALLENIDLDRQTKDTYKDMLEALTSLYDPSCYGTNNDVVSNSPKFLFEVRMYYESEILEEKHLLQILMLRWKQEQQFWVKVFLGRMDDKVAALADETQKVEYQNLLDLFRQSFEESMASMEI
eukprot:scaffold2234_cov165-Amphora_coffeaeformis.AAC.10